MGSCKDPFVWNATQVEKEQGVTAVPCASGWCGKVIEGDTSFREDGEFFEIHFTKSFWIKQDLYILDYDMATQRMCVQRGPSDSEDRCAYTTYNYKKVYMCFCQGDLCNTATKNIRPSFNYLLGLSVLSAFMMKVLL